MKTKTKILAVILTLIMALMPITTTACSLFGPSENDIEIVSQGLEYDSYYRLCFYVKIKNKSSRTINCSFYGKICLGGESVAEGLSGTKILYSGESAVLVGPVIANPTYYKNSYTYKIVKWNFYNV